MKTICIIGLGYIGLPTASLFANNGFQVVGVDVNSKVVELINSGKNHIEEAGLRTLVEAAVRSGHLRAITTPSPADVFIIAVPTPIDEAEKPDLSHVDSSIDSIVPVLQRDNLLIVESTVPPGTTDAIANKIAKKRSDLVDDPKDPVKSLQVSIAHCPERVLPGRILNELVNNDRVVGGVTEAASRKAAQLYSKIVTGTIYQTDATTAEMVKLSENTFRDVNIALANELAVICEKLGINVWEVIELANKHPRVKFLKPGPGVGGHCIAVDPWFIIAKFHEDAKVMRAARLRNDAMPAIVVKKILDLTKGEKSSKIACLGVSYKGNVGDPRNSPAIEVYENLISQNGNASEILINDMHVTNSNLPLKPLELVIRDATIVVILADHDEYKILDPNDVGKKVKRKLLYDTRNLLDHAKWRAAGFEVHLLGADKIL